MGLLQSSVLCLDVLTRSLGKSHGWKEILTDTLRELVSLAWELSSKPSVSSEELLASVLLCCGTLAATVGPAAVQILPVFRS